MKKGSSNKTTDYKHFDWYTVESVMASKKQEGKRTALELADGVVLSIFESNKDYDFGNINIFGFFINVTFRSGKNGMFISFPSVKGKDGYVDIAGCFDRSFHELISKVLEEYYS